VKIVAVASGKGGVGKSTISLNLARALAQRGDAVGLLDADVYAPDIPVMLGLKQTRELRWWDLGRNPRFGRIELDPVDILGIKVMSVGFLIAESQAFTLEGPFLEHVGRQLFEHVRWGDLDYLVVDLPPGTADFQQQLFKSFPVAGVVIVVGPQDAAHLDARKVLALLRDAQVPVLGAIENMRALRCPHCGELVEVFPPVAAGRSILQEVPMLGSLPLDPALARLDGIPTAFADIANRVAAALA
jgi:ATP-binding protein involved in chromosome partitioning